MKLTQEEKRIKLAEAAGWDESPSGKWSNNGFILPDPLNPPDYFNDLNAVHELELKVFLDSSIQLDYARSLIRIIKNSSPLGKRFFSDFDLVTATAAQRAEAIGLIFNLW